MGCCVCLRYFISHIVVVDGMLQLALCFEPPPPLRMYVVGCCSTFNTALSLIHELSV